MSDSVPTVDDALTPITQQPQGDVRQTFRTTSAHAFRGASIRLFELTATSESLQNNRHDV